MISYAVYGCFYKYPEPNVKGAPRKPPSDPTTLRAWQLVDMCPMMKNIPICIFHTTRGVLPDPTEPDGTHIPVDSMFSGSIEVGKVLAAWVDMDTSAAHWLGEVTYDPATNPVFHSILGMRDVYNMFRSCSLTHMNMSLTQDAYPVNMSLNSVGRRAGAVVYWDGNYEVYLRKTGFLKYIHRSRLVSASMADTSSQPPAPVPTPAADVDPAKLPPVQKPGSVKRVLELLETNGDAVPPEILEHMSDAYAQIAKLEKQLAAKSEEAHKTHLEALHALKMTMAELAASDNPRKTEFDQLVSQPVLVEASALAENKVPALFDILRIIPTMLKEAKEQSSKRSRTEHAAPVPQHVPYPAMNVGADRKAPIANSVLLRVQKQLRDQQELEAVRSAATASYMRRQMTSGPGVPPTAPPQMAYPLQQQRVEASILGSQLEPQMQYDPEYHAREASRAMYASAAMNAPTGICLRDCGPAYVNVRENAEQISTRMNTRDILLTE